MPRPPSSVPLALLAASLLAAPAAADVLVVDANGLPGADFTAVRPPIDAALDGDVLLLRTGAYDGFTLSGKSLTLSAFPYGGVAPPGALGLVAFAPAPSLALGGPVETQLYLAGPLVVAPLSPATLAFTATAPELGPGNEDAAVYAQAGVVLPTGAFVRSSPTAIVLLDAGF